MFPHGKAEAEHQVFGCFDLNHQLESQSWCQKPGPHKRRVCFHFLGSIDRRACWSHCLQMWFAGLSCSRKKKSSEKLIYIYIYIFISYSLHLKWPGKCAFLWISSVFYRFRTILSQTGVKPFNLQEMGVYELGKPQVNQCLPSLVLRNAKWLACPWLYLTTAMAIHQNFAKFYPPKLWKKCKHQLKPSISSP